MAAHESTGIAAPGMAPESFLYDVAWLLNEGFCAGAWLLECLPLS